MFKNANHGGPAVEVFTAAGKDPLKNFKVDGSAKNVQKIFDKQMKGSIYNLDGATTKIQIPANEKDTLGLLQPFLVFQIYIPSSAKNLLKIELAITDAEKTKRRLIFHSGSTNSKDSKGQGGIVTNPFHARIPISSFKRDQWLNLSIDVFAFAHYCFKGVQPKTLDLISITSMCKLRKIFTMRCPTYDDDIDGSAVLQDALDKLTMDEFGGNSSQILFEFVPKNLDFVANSCTYANQFIFPQRIIKHEEAVAAQSAS